MTPVKSDKLSKNLAYIIMAVLVLLPFHALLTTWAGSNFGHLDAWRIWKEVIIFALVPVTVWLALGTPELKRWLQKAWLPRLLLAYLALNLVLGAWALSTNHVNGPALIYGLFADLRYFGFFAICLTVAAHSKQLVNNWWRLILIPAAFVVGLGLIQLTLPIDFLRHFGYGPDTIPAFQTVDQKLAYQRIQSTLRGANPLGAYLVLVITAIWAYKSRRKWAKYAFLAAALAALFFSYSRSAWLGALVALATFGFIQYQKWWLRRKWLIAAAIASLAIIASLLLFGLRHNDRLENTLFHTDETSLSTASSNASRVGALKSGVTDLLIEPLGRGPGTAGPASNRNDHPARIAENYYLQIAQETGWLGLGLFMTINIMVALMLWQHRRETTNLVLLSSLIGLSVVSLVSHAWADDTLGLLWWGLAGIALAPAIMNKKRKRNEVKKTAKTRN